jgi:hypothetical protein
MPLRRLLLSLTWIAVAFSLPVHGQDARWSIDRSAIGLGPVTDPLSLSQANPNYVNPNKTLRAIQTPYKLLVITPNFRVPLRPPS